MPKFRWFKFFGLVTICSGPALLLVAGLDLLTSWLAGYDRTETVISLLVVSVPVPFVVGIGGLKATYGPDWREGLRRYKRWLIGQEEWPEGDMAWDGSSQRLGIESVNTEAARQRWPGWFSRQGMKEHP